MHDKHKDRRDNGEGPEDSVFERARKKLERDCGPLLIGALNDPKTIEVMLNEDGRLWHEKLGEEMTCIGSLSVTRADSILSTVAGCLGKEATAKTPIVEGEWPLDGSRFAGARSPSVKAPIFAIRKKAVKIFTLDQYVEHRVMTAHQSAVVKQAVADHRNILVIGGTGSGKTTLVNAIINQMVLHNTTERVVIIEDTGEIQCAADNFIQFHTSLEVGMTELLKLTLRMRPDRILVGEVRGAEALDLLDAWNTGHEGGTATLHANNAYAGLARLKSLITRNKAAPSEIEPLIGEVVHVVVHIAKTTEGRRVQEILEVSGYENGQYITRNL